MKIRAKLIILTLACSLLPLLPMAVISFSSSRQALEQTIAGELAAGTSELMEDVEARFAQSVSDMGAWAALAVMQDVLTDDPDGAITRQLGHLREHYPRFSAFLVLNDKGVVVAATRPGVVGSNLSDSPAFTTAMAKAAWQGKVAAGSSEALEMTLAAPIAASYDAQTIVGVLIGVIDWNSIQHDLAGAPIGGHRQDATHRLVLLDRESAHVLYQTGAGQLGADAWNKLPADPGAVETLAGATPVLAGTAISEGVREFADPGWIMHEVIDTGVAYAGVTALRGKLLLLAAAVMVAVVVVAWLTATRFTAPILALTARMTRLAKRDMEAPVTGLERRDEIGAMAQAVEIFKESMIENERLTLLQKAERENEERLRRILDTAVDAIVRTDAQGHITAWNDQAVAIFGWTADEVAGKRVGDVIIPERYREAHERGMALARESESLLKEGRRMEAVGLHRSGRTFPIEVAIAAVATPEGIVFSAFIRDITERKQIEENLVLAATVFINSGEGIIITDPDNKIIAVNPAFTAITGYAPEEVLGNRPNVLKSGKHDERFYKDMWSSLKEAGRWQGEIWNKRKDGAIFPEWLTAVRVQNHTGDTSNFIATFQDITERKAQAERIERMAHYDHLTGLPNRALLKDRLERAVTAAKRNHRGLAVMFLDLDRFKPINDTYGHAAGDDLLQQVAKRLLALVRESDTVSRLGGDEFVVLLLDVGDAAIACAIAAKIIDALARPFEVEGHAVNTGTSVGIALYPGDGRDPEELLKAADAAMYEAKQSGRGTHRLAAPRDLETT
jgi:diguanylate cyclase (GGDEF)-like protein/PAS domain S-box-containing protein